MVKAKISDLSVGRKLVERKHRLQKVNGTSIIQKLKRYDKSLIIESRERTVR